MKKLLFEKSDLPTKSTADVMEDMPPEDGLGIKHDKAEDNIPYGNVLYQQLPGEKKPKK